MADRHGYVQTVLETAPQLVDQLISDAAHYPNTDNVRSLIAAGIDAHKLTVAGPNRGHLPDPLTEAEIRVLEALPQLPDLRRHGRPAPPVPQHRQDPSPPHLHEAGRLLPHRGDQAGHLHRHHLTVASSGEMLRGLKHVIPRGVSTHSSVLVRFSRVSTAVPAVFPAVATILAPFLAPVDAVRDCGRGTRDSPMEPTGVPTADQVAGHHLDNDTAASVIRGQPHAAPIAD